MVNCGTGGAMNQSWNTGLRATAAHSTVTLADTLQRPHPAAGHRDAICWVLC